MMLIGRRIIAKRLNASVFPSGCYVERTDLLVNSFLHFSDYRYQRLFEGRDQGSCYFQLQWQEKWMQIRGTSDERSHQQRIRR